MTATTETLCEFCDEPFEPVPFDLPAPGGGFLSVKTTACPRCSKAKGAKPVSAFTPVPVPSVTINCVICGELFTTDAVKFPGDGKQMKEALSHATVCDDCATVEAMARPGPINPTQEDRRRKQWVGMTGIRYADFKTDELPKVIRPHVDRVMAWKPQPVGIGLIGDSRIGKSPLIYALGQSLFLAGHDVFPTTGLEFQRKYQRSFDKGEAVDWTRYLKDCENCEVLLIDDADKLNLTAGVEAEYYGMLEARRNWMRPVLCTLNLTGAEIAALGRERTDRSKAIVERLRDVCEIISVA